MKEMRCWVCKRCGYEHDHPELDLEAPPCQCGALSEWTVRKKKPRSYPMLRMIADNKLPLWSFNAIKDEVTTILAENANLRERLEKLS